MREDASDLPQYVTDLISIKSRTAVRCRDYVRKREKINLNIHQNLYIMECK